MVVHDFKKEEDDDNSVEMNHYQQAI